MFDMLSCYKRHFETLLQELSKKPSMNGYYYILGYLRAGLQTGLIRYGTCHTMTERAISVMDTAIQEKV